jgi:hypothetical protein
MKRKYLEERFGSPVILGEFADGDVGVDDPYLGEWFGRLPRAEAERFIRRHEKLIDELECLHGKIARMRMLEATDGDETGDGADACTDDPAA